MPLAARLAPLLAVLVAAPAAAQLSFVPFGARSVALGGASVALGDAGSFVDNPATLPESKLVAAASVGLVASESGDFIDRLKDVSGVNPVSLAAGSNAASVLAAFRTLAEPGNGIAGDGRLMSAGTSKGWGLALGQISWGGVSARIDSVHVKTGSDPATSWANNTSAVAFRGLSVQAISVSRAFRFASGRVVVGGTVHLLRGTTYSKEESMFTTEVGNALELARRAVTGSERTSTKLSGDVGALVALGPVRLGGVVKYFNRPEFPFDDETGTPAPDRNRSVLLGRQSRVGAAVSIPVVRLTLAADYDVEAAESLADGVKTRLVGGGAEFALGPISIRGGLSVNLESPDKTKLFSAGIGLSAAVLKVDAAAVYRPDESSLGVVLSIRGGV